MSKDHTNNPIDPNNGPQPSPTSATQNTTNPSDTHYPDLLQQAVEEANIVETSQSDTDDQETQIQKPTFHCPINCGQTYNCRKSIIQHMLKKHAEYIEYGSEGNFVKKDDLGPDDQLPRGDPFLLNKVSDYDKRMLCTICAREYSTGRNLRSHVRQFHKKCVEVEKWNFVLIDELDPDDPVHQAAHERISPRISQGEEGPFFLETKYSRLTKDTKHYTHTCTMCDKSYTTKAGLNVHVRAKHADDPRRDSPDLLQQAMIGASLGQLAYRRRDDVDLHRRYKCTMCDKAYTTNQSLKSHIRAKHRDDNASIDRNQPRVAHDYECHNQTDVLAGNGASFTFPMSQNDNVSMPVNRPSRTSISLLRAMPSSTFTESSSNVSNASASTSPMVNAANTGDEDIELIPAPFDIGIFRNYGTSPGSNNVAFKNPLDDRDEHDLLDDIDRDDESTFAFPMSPNFNTDNVPLNTHSGNWSRTQPQNTSTPINMYSRTVDDSSYGTFEESLDLTDDSVVTISNPASYDIQTCARHPMEQIHQIDHSYCRDPRLTPQTSESRKRVHRHREDNKQHLSEQHKRAKFHEK